MSHLSNSPGFLIRRIPLRRASDVPPRKQGFLIYPHLPDDKLVLLGGGPGDGKTAVALALCSALSRGEAPLGMDAVAKPLTCIYYSVEDTAEESLVPRLLAMGADTDRIFVLGVGDVDADGEPVPMTLTPELVACIGLDVAEHGAKLVVLDTVAGLFDAKTNTDKQNQVRPSLKLLMDLAKRQSCCVLILAHLNKAGEGRSISRILGSIDFVAAARVVLVCAPYPEPPTFALSISKSNVGPTNCSIGYKVDKDANRRFTFEWLGEVEISAEDLIRPKGKSGNKGDSRSRCEKWLLELLETGPKLRNAVIEEAHDAGFPMANITKVFHKLARDYDPPELKTEFEPGYKIWGSRIGKPPAWWGLANQDWLPHWERRRDERIGKARTTNGQFTLE